MKRLIKLVLTFVFLLGMFACSKQTKGNLLLSDSNVSKVHISSLPEEYVYSFNEEKAEKVLDYLKKLNLDSKFEENPDSHIGMTWVIIIEYDNGNVLTVYHFGNMFIRFDDGEWYKMIYEEACRLDDLLNELNEW